MNPCRCLRHSFDLAAFDSATTKARREDLKRWAVCRDCLFVSNCERIHDFCASSHERAAAIARELGVVQRPNDLRLLVRIIDEALLHRGTVLATWICLRYGIPKGTRRVVYRNRGALSAHVRATGHDAGLEYHN